jgi:hypothetical protein
MMEVAVLTAISWMIRFEEMNFKSVRYLLSRQLQVGGTKTFCPQESPQNSDLAVFKDFHVHWKRRPQMVV